jgi:hypothetical protein
VSNEDEPTSRDEWRRKYQAMQAERDTFRNELEFAKARQAIAEAACAGLEVELEGTRRLLQEARSEAAARGWREADTTGAFHMLLDTLKGCGVRPSADTAHPVWPDDAERLCAWVDQEIDRLKVSAQVYVGRAREVDTQVRTIIESMSNAIAQSGRAIEAAAVALAAMNGGKRE